MDRFDGSYKLDAARRYADTAVALGFPFELRRELIIAYLAGWNALRDSVLEAAGDGL